MNRALGIMLFAMHYLGFALMIAGGGALLLMLVMSLWTTPAALGVMFASGAFLVWLVDSLINADDESNDTD